MSGTADHAGPRPRGETATHFLVVLALPILVFALYAAALDGPFVFDDPNGISQNGLIRSVRPLDRFLVFSTRPLTDLSYALDYARGGQDPRPYHVTSVLLHALNALLVYALTWHTLGSPSLHKRYGARRWPVAAAAAALFAAHPLATETVAYLSSRSEVLCAPFYLLTLLCYVRAVGAERPPSRLLYSAGIIGSTAAALASKEIAMTIPVALLLYDYCFLSRGSFRKMKGRRWLLGLSAIPLVAGGAFLAYRALTTTVSFGAYRETAGFGFDRFGPWHYLLTQFGVILRYLRLAVLPIGLTFDYDWKLADSIWEPEVLFSALVLAFLLALAIRLRRQWPLATFALLFTFVVLSPTSSLMPLADLAVERRMYVPLFAVAMFAAAWLSDAVGPAGREDRTSAPRRWTRYASLVAVPLLVFSVLTARRAALWGDAVALHRDGVAKAPENPRLRLNLGVIYLNLGRLDEAEAELSEAKRLYDRGVSVHAFDRIGAFIQYNLGAVLYLNGDSPAAARELARSLKSGARYQALRPMAFYLLGRIAAEEEEWESAAARFREAVRHAPDRADWYVELARAEVNAGQVDEARKTLFRLLRRFPDHEEGAQLSRQLRLKRARPSAPGSATAESGPKGDTGPDRNATLAQEGAGTEPAGTPSSPPGSQRGPQP